MISFATKAANQKIKAISDECFGDNYLSTEYINQCILNKQVIVINGNEQINGFCIFTINQTTDHSSIFHQSELNNITTYGVIATIAVCKQQRSKGYGSKLIKEVISILKQKKLPLIIYKAWDQSPSHHFVKKIMDIGFKKHDSFPNYWEKASINQSFHCAICGAPPCQCSMSVYSYKLT